MQLILFRGKRTDNGEWVEGYYIRASCSEIEAVIIPARSFAELNRTLRLEVDEWWEVDPSTVGQYTGLTDKNGKKIFEGDIVRGRHWTSYNDKNPEDFHLWRVDWSEKSGLITFVDSPTTKARMSIHDFADFEEVEVIGNIHDNPELLEVSHE